MSDIEQRKDEHLDITVQGDVGFRETTTLFECVTLVHDALPELDFEAIDLGCQVLGKRLRAPILIAAMTGGTARARRINEELAAIAEARGYAFGLGSQRPMLRSSDALPSYRVRDVAPTALVLGNIGAVQATRLGRDEVQRLVDSVGADALCVHLNPAQELVQTGGDRDFRGNLDTLAELGSTLRVPLIVKETGCGLSYGVARRLVDRGIRHVDVSGAGGTSWVAVECHRAREPHRRLGETFREWGIPTAASVAFCAAAGLQTIFATGGVRSGLDVARAIALGASAAGVARDVLRALEEGGRAGAQAFLERLETELRMAMLLVGAADLGALRRAPRVFGARLREWIDHAD
jgi:isopentenyl-diphosphate delta-isomerase